MIGYKLTTQEYKTRPGEYNETLWGPGVTHETSGELDLCTPGWIHYYEDLLVAVVMNPCHGNYFDPVLWKCSIEGKVIRDGDLKSGTTKLTTLEIVPLPVFTWEQRVRFAIRCALAVCNYARGVAWADNWLRNVDREVITAKNTAEDMYQLAVDMERIITFQYSAARIRVAIGVVKGVMWEMNNAGWVAWAAKSAELEEEGQPIIKFARWAVSDRIEWRNG